MLLGCGFGWQKYEFVHAAVKTDALVVGNTKFAAPDGSVAYRPIFQFTTPDGRKRTGEADAGSHTQGYVPGDRIRVVYLADDPYGAQMDSFQQLWLVPVSLGGIGALLLGLGWGIRALGVMRQYRWVGGA
ncbi:DUF3592 domain-containing protein [Granulicella tundricola]|uniref:DUF3592 domain-containing protein n=1 Tax=Granulicella tundricola TaxID=940615 RepID=UPI0002F452F8|nr:DUF3592 domain-containing protein [Granulicella tundricola]